MKEYLAKQFQVTYQEEADLFLSCGGRFEVLGNHTDHNRGLCLAATCSLSEYAAFKKRKDKTIRLLSEGYGNFEVDLSSLNMIDNEKGGSTAMIRGIAKYLSDKGYKIGGFDAYIKSELPRGAGVSSSAAFELLIAQAFNTLFNDSKIELITLCHASQFAEREYYGKPCGLLDQVGVSFGGVTFIDFKDVLTPTIRKFYVDSKDYQFVIINTGGNHAELTELYRKIQNQMFEVAAVFGQSYLRDVNYEDLKKNKQDVIEKCGKEAYQKAVHFFEENKRVEKAVDALEKEDIAALVELMNKSRESSTKFLGNMYVDKIKGSPLEACKLVLKASHQKAGVKVNGGGFAGSVIALVPNKEVNAVVKAAKEKYGKENVYLVDVRNEKPSEM